MSRDLLVLAPLRIEAFALRRGLPASAVLRTGMGRARSERAAAWLIGSHRGAFAVAGVCGALDPRLVPGDLVVASELRGAGAPLVLESAKALARALEARGFAVHIGPIHSTDHLAPRREQAELAAQGAMAVDMESAWLARLAASAPFAVLRVVSDGPGHSPFSPRIVPNGIRALRRLAAAAPALADWATHTHHPLEAHR